MPRLLSYDAQGRLSTVKSMKLVSGAWLGEDSTYTYNAFGQVQSVREANGVTTTYGYDLARRLTTVR